MSKEDIEPKKILKGLGAQEIMDFPEKHFYDLVKLSQNKKETAPKINK